MNDVAISSGNDGGIFGLSLCAGAGGLDLGLHLAIDNYRTVGYVERDSFAAATLVARMEDEALDCAPVWDDVTTFDGQSWRGVVDIIHGGYPCQPFSVAGRKLGDKDPRHLWPHIRRIVDEVEPPLCFFENVGGHLRLGFEQVHDDLQSMGYRVKAGLFTAAEVGASHRRERLFILAYRSGIFGERRVAEGSGKQQQQAPAGSECRVVADATRPGAGQHQLGPRVMPSGGEPAMGDANGTGLERRSHAQYDSADEEFAFPPGPTDHGRWWRLLIKWPDLEPAVRRGADGLANRVDRLRLCGNGVVPLAAAYAFHVLSTQAELFP